MIVWDGRPMYVPSVAARSIRPQTVQPGVQPLPVRNAERRIVRDEVGDWAIPPDVCGYFATPDATPFGPLGTLTDGTILVELCEHGFSKSGCRRIDQISRGAKWVWTGSQIEKGLLHRHNVMLDIEQKTRQSVYTHPSILVIRFLLAVSKLHRKGRMQQTLRHKVEHS